MTTKYCNCAEGTFEGVDGLPHRTTGQHDCDYIAQRNSLVDEAERMAEETLAKLNLPATIKTPLGKDVPNPQRFYRFNELFARAMDTLWATRQQQRFMKGWEDHD
jgi:hypothetical protein